MLLTDGVMSRLQTRKMRLLGMVARHAATPDDVVMLSCSMRRTDSQSVMAGRFGIGKVPGSAIQEIAVLSHLKVAESGIALTPYLEGRAAAIRRAADSGIRTGRAQSYAGEMNALGSSAIAAHGAGSR